MSAPDFKKPFLPKKRDANEPSPSETPENELSKTAKLHVEDTLAAIPITVESVNTFIKSLQQAQMQNEELRHKYSKEPERFFDSEATLHNELHKLLGITTETPVVMCLFDNEEFLATLLSILSHPNVDIVLNIVKFLAEVTDVEDIEEEGDMTTIQTIAMHLLGAGFIAALLERVQELEEFDETEAELATSSIEVIENLVFSGLEILMESPPKSLTEGWSIWLTNCAIYGSLPATIRYYSTEVLAHLTMAISEVRMHLIGEGALALILEECSRLAITPPRDADEIEYDENMIDILSSLLLESSGQEAFVASDGFDLIFLMLAAHKTLSSALKVLSFAILDHRSMVTSTTFISSKGLDYLLEATKHVKKIEDTDRIVSVLLNLFLTCSSGVSSSIASFIPFLTGLSTADNLDLLLLFVFDCCPESKAKLLHSFSKERATVSIRTTFEDEPSIQDRLNELLNKL